MVYYNVGGDRFGAILDTGSPFLVVPNYCQPRKYGCYQASSSQPSGLATTTERFDNNQGQVEWRMAPFSFVDAYQDNNNSRHDSSTSTTISSSSTSSISSSVIGPSQRMIFGVLSESLMDGSGGVFFGLIRDTESWIRPSFLGQTNVKAMTIDLRGNDDDRSQQDSINGKSLTLYTRASTRPSRMIEPNSTYISLTRDLNRKYGDPVIHYTAKASSFTVNGNSVLKPNDHKPMYVIFDTGVTGMVVSQELFDQRYTDARLRKEKSLWGNVVVTFLVERNLEDRSSEGGNDGRSHNMEGQTISLVAQKPVTTPLGMKPWPKFKNAHLIVLGLAFLDGRRIEIDMDGNRLQLL